DLPEPMPDQERAANKETGNFLEKTPENTKKTTKYKKGSQKFTSNEGICSKKVEENYKRKKGKLGNRRLSINDARPKERFPKVEEKERPQEVQGNHITQGKETGDSPERCKAPGT
ncbi:7475_t:CDS:2, partial [Gigaspora rosea]